MYYEFIRLKSHHALRRICIHGIETIASVPSLVNLCLGTAGPVSCILSWIPDDHKNLCFHLLHLVAQKTNISRNLTSLTPNNWLTAEAVCELVLADFKALLLTFELLSKICV